MEHWKKQLLWVLGILLGLPLLFFGFLAFMLFVFYPLQHKVQVALADRANSALWETDEARAATLEIDVTHDGNMQTLSAEMICYESEVARPWTLKEGAPKRYTSQQYDGPDALEMLLENGASIMIEIDYPCRLFLPASDSDLWDLESLDVYVVNENATHYCRERIQSGWSASDLSISAARLSDKEIAPLRSLIPRDEFSSSSTLPSSSLWEKHGSNLRKAHWSEKHGCWIGNGGLCDPELSALCQRPEK